MAAPMKVSLPQTMLQKLLDLLKLESFRPHSRACNSKNHPGSEGCRDLRTHIQHESAALIGLFHTNSSLLSSVESLQNYWKPTQRGVQGYLSSLAYSTKIRKLTFCHEVVPDNECGEGDGR